jgi:hypothetical protein
VPEVQESLLESGSQNDREGLIGRFRCRERLPVERDALGFDRLRFVPAIRD